MEIKQKERNWPWDLLHGTLQSGVGYRLSYNSACKVPVSQQIGCRQCAPSIGKLNSANEQLDPELDAMQGHRRHRSVHQKNKRR